MLYTQKHKKTKNKQKKNKKAGKKKKAAHGSMSPFKQ
jgi:hypothetical protein